MKLTMSDHHVLETPMDKTGFFAAGMSIFMNIYNWVSMEHINGVLVFCTTVFATIFTYYKFKNERIMYMRNKKKDRKDKIDNENNA